MNNKNIISEIIVALLWVALTFRIYNKPEIDLVVLLFFLTLGYIHFFLKWKANTNGYWLLTTILLSYAVLIFVYNENDVDTVRCVCKVEKIEHLSRTQDYIYRMFYYDDNNIRIDVSANYYKKLADERFLVDVKNNRGHIVLSLPKPFDFEKFKYPVKYVRDSIELGNNSYEYAKYERDIAYNNYGLNIVQIANSLNDDAISFVKLNGISETIKYRNNGTDSFLVYSNINPKFFDGWHVCPDSISTPENFAKIEEGGYGYIFRGKIYSKEETEKYWNIIEQYKLREAGK